jgi:Sec7-like guanine-nucleotide exchange factor
MEFKGTKGDWATGLFPNLNHPHRTVLTEEGIEICTIHLDNEEIRANAKLIAAAPELLDALQNYMRQLNNPALREFKEGTVEKMEKAINKALN